MCRFIFTLLILIPATEITGLIWLASVVGALECLTYVCLTAALGLALFRRQGASLPLRLQRGEVEPTAAALETAGITLGAVCLMVPGLVTDTLGLALLIPPIRVRIARRLSHRMTRPTLERMSRPYGPSEDVIVIKKNEKK